MPEALPSYWDLGLRHLLRCGGKSTKVKAWKQAKSYLGWFALAGVFHLAACLSLLRS